MSIQTATQQAQITFKTDTKLKDNVLSKVKKEGITLKALLTMAMQAYIDKRLMVGVYPEIKDEYDELFKDKEIIAKANQLGELLQNKKI